MGESNFFDEGVNVDGLFDNVSQATLEKALTAGYGANAADFSGGRALQPEDLESTLVNVLDVLQDDCKVFNSIHRQPSKSTVHQYNRRTGVGDDEFNFIGEGEDIREDDQSIERKILEQKYIGTIGRITKQAELVESMEDMYNAEKVACTMRVVKSAERAFFHGNSAVVPKQFDGFQKIIEDSAADTEKETRLRATVADLRGYEIGEKVDSGDKVITGEDLFDEVADSVYEKGGDLCKALFPPVVARQFRSLFNDKLRYTPEDNHTGLKRLPDIIASCGSTIRIQGKDAGTDKMFHVKGAVFAKGDSTKRPNAPSSVTLTVNASPVGDKDSKFATKDAGDYIYAVHAVNSHGVSVAKAAAAAAAVAAGKTVTITITPDSNGARPTGFVITRSRADGSDLMEMCSVLAAVEGNTTFEDVNADLPGTASIILLSEITRDAKANIAFTQLMGLSTFPLPTNDSLAKRFAVALFGALKVGAPEFCAEIKNVGYRGGLY